MSIINAVILDKKNQYVKLIAFVSVNNGMTEKELIRSMPFTVAIEDLNKLGES